MPVDPRDRLTAAALQAVRDIGIAGISARSIARIGGFSQALIFYHFDSVEDLLVAACEVGARARVDHWRDRLATVTSFTELVTVAQAMHAGEESRGNVTVLAQFLAGAQTHPRLAAATAEALDAWHQQLRPLVARLVSAGVAGGLLDPDDLSALLADAFIGIELAACTRDEAQLQRRFAALRHVAGLLETVNDLGPVASGMLHRRLARRTT